MDTRFFVPWKDRRRIVENLHKGQGHLGIDGPYNLVKRRYWWPDIKQTVVEHIQFCEQCQLLTPDKSSKKEQKVPSGKLMSWGLDVVGLPPESEQGIKYIITALENLTRWPVVKAIKGWKQLT